jgi:nucleotide-binding universal stress UspA family protein
MTESLLVPLDESPVAEAGLAAARDLAGLIGASIRLMTVVIPNSDEAEAAEYLRAAAARAGVEPTGVEVIASTGPAREIVDSAEAHGDLVCMATHGRGRLGELLLGSVSQAVIGRSTAPVLLVGPDAQVAPQASGPVLVPLDGSPSATTALPPAIAWASELRVGLHLVHVTPPGSIGTEGTDPNALIETVSPHEGPAGLEVTAEVIEGNPAALVVDAARDQHASLIVLTSRGATDELTLSKVARRIIRDAPVPVLVVPHRVP